MAKPPRLSLPALALCLALAGAALVSALAQAGTPHVYVQKRDREIDSGTSVSVAFAKANKAGNTIIVFVVWDNGPSVSLSDSRGNAYDSAVGPTASGDGSMRAQIFYARDVAAGANTVTASFANPVSAHAALYVHEYTGLSRLVPFDAAVGASGTTETTIDSEPVPTHGSSELLFAGVASNGRSIKTLTRGFKTRAHRGGELTSEGFSGPADSNDYRLALLQSGTSWVLQLAAFQYTGTKPSSPEYPLQVSENGRYLVDQNGVPFLMTGDSPQALFANLSVSEAGSFFANRKKRGFNTLWINLLCAEYTGGRPDASTFDGIRPFESGSNPGNFDLSTPSEEYFSRIDAVLRLAAQNGITVVLDPIETGSFLDTLRANGVTKARAWGQYLGKRYGGFENIVWMSGNDFGLSEPPSAGDAVLVQAVARGIQDLDDEHIHTVELNYYVSGSLDDPSWAPLIQLNASYTYFPTYAQVLKDYNRPNALPTFMVEANYEFEHQALDPPTTELLRRQAYWSLLSGATGQLYGSSVTSDLPPDWKSHIDTPGAIQMGYVKRLFESRRWWDLVPDQDHFVVTDGFGTFSSGGALGANDYVTAARTPDGSLLIAYLPTPTTITVDMSRLAGPVKASWYDPSRGSFKSISRSRLPNTGSTDFTSPGPNRDKDTDWVLVLETD